MIDLYLGFDCEFFYASWHLAKEEAREHRMKVGEQYRTFLHDYTSVLDNILCKRNGLEALGEEG